MRGGNEMDDGGKEEGDRRRGAVLLLTDCFNRPAISDPMIGSEIQTPVKTLKQGLHYLKVVSFHRTRQPTCTIEARATD
jgi:hypothetical protein